MQRIYEVMKPMVSGTISLDGKYDKETVEAETCQVNDCGDLIFSIPAMTSDVSKTDKVIRAFCKGSWCEVKEKPFNQ
jgi:hypothetical protein